jgi:hypothetical protein
MTYAEEEREDRLQRRFDTVKVCCDCGSPVTSTEERCGVCNRIVRWAEGDGEYVYDTVRHMQRPVGVRLRLGFMMMREDDHTELDEHDEAQLHTLDISTYDGDRLAACG